MTSTIKVFLAALPRMAGDILRGWFRGQSDIELTDSPGTVDELPRVLRDPGVDAVIVGVEGQTLPPGVEDITRAYPEVRLLGLSADGSEAFVFEWRALARSLGPASPELLTRTLRHGPAGSPEDTNGRALTGPDDSRARTDRPGTGGAEDPADPRTEI